MKKTKVFLISIIYFNNLNNSAEIDIVFREPPEVRTIPNNEEKLWSKDIL